MFVYSLVNIDTTQGRASYLDLKAFSYEDIEVANEIIENTNGNVLRDR